MIVVYDVEQFKNFHCLYALDIQTNKRFYFEISDFRDDKIGYLNFLDQVDGMIGFNNLHYDQHMVKFIKLNIGKKPGELARMAYKYGQQVINNNYQKLRVSIPSQCDLFRIMHFNNKAKSTSLKNLQFAMRWEKLQDLPYRFDSTIDSEMRKEVKGYVENDVLSTFEFYKKVRYKINLRNDLRKRYGFNCLNWDDSKIGEQIVISEVNRKNNNEIRLIRSTYKNEIIPLKDLLIPFDFKNEEVIKEKERFEGLYLKRDEFKGTISNRVVVNDFPFDFGAGGIHGCTYSGTYEPKENEKIKSSDVSSYYPNLAVSKGFYINQCGPTYIDVIKDLYNRKESTTGHERDSVKLGLVSVFGKSNDQWSNLLDPYYFLQTTINGQLFLTDLAISLIKEGFKPLMCNTDGIEFIISKDKEDRYMEICNEWCKQTGLILEHDNYKKLAIKDVNNYIGIFEDGSIKKKGMFETEKDWHKDHSFLIIPKAIEKYIVEGVRPEDYIPQHNDIFDFCGGVKAIGAFKIEHHTLKDSKIKIAPLQKTNRVFISNKGGTLYKRKREKILSVYKGLKTTIFNDFYPSDDYNINYKWYISEVQKWIDVIEPKQTSLF